MKNLFLHILIIPLIASSQNYNGPESVEYNNWWNNSTPYFISNSSNGQILALDDDGDLSVFADGLNTGPHGLEFGLNGIGFDLYACSGGRLYGFDEEGNQVLNYNLNGSFLNGITSRLFIEPATMQGDGDLLITDFSAKKLYRYDILEGAHYEICSFPKSPNGVYWDAANNRALVVCWGSNAPIYEVDVENGTYNTLINTGLSNLDGITKDACGDFYVTAWSSNALHKYNSDFTETEIIATGLSNPADICYNPNDNIIGVPNSGNNTVDFIEVDCDNVTIPEIQHERSLIKTIDILGRETTQKGFKLEIYDDGSVEKKYLLK
jgi:sugar lactone lactonase YvrE